MLTKTFAAATVLFVSASMAFAALPVDAPSTSSANAVTVETYDVATTNGMDRRGDRRDTRQDCRQDNGVVGKDKRDCKQDSRRG